MAAIDAMSVVILLAFVIMATFGIYAARYKKVPPDKAMVVYGKRQKGTKKGYRVISGGAKFIVPILESYEFLPLDVRTLDVVVNDIVTDVKQSGAKINIKCVCQPDDHISRLYIHPCVIINLR